MAEKVGEIYYQVSLDTREMIDGQRKVDRELKNTTSSLDGMSNKLTATAAAVAVLAAGFAALKIAKLADEFRLLGARVEIAAGGIQAGADAMRDLIAISQRTSTSLAGNAEVFQRLNQSILQMGGTQRDTLQVTELLGKAIKVSGASANEAKSAMLQFGQALGSGKLQGDELRSLMENAPYLMKQLADGIGVPVGALKELGEQGKLTSDVVTNALVKAADKIDQDFKKVPLTIEAAMVVAQDQAGLAALKFDELTGSSATLAGVTKGVGEVLDALALQFGAATTEADKLGRSNTVQSWADSTVTALSYVADAGDFVVRVFKQAGLLIGGLLASSTALLSGEAKSAKMILEETFNDIKANSDRMYAGRKIRQRQEALASTPDADRLDRMAAGGGRASSKLSAPVGGGKKDSKKGGGAKFDSEAYLSDLRKAQASEISIINETETEKLRVAKRNLEEKKLNEAQYAEAVMLIQTAAEDDRVELMRKTQEKINQERERADIAAQRAAEQRKSNLDVAKQTVVSTDPIAAIRFEEEQRIAVIEAYRLQDLANTQVYEDAKKAIHAKAAKDVQAVQDASMVAQLQGYGQLFGGIADVTKMFAGEQDDTYKALFAASKAFAMADAIVKIQQAMASASMSLPFPANLGAIATVAAQTAGIVSTISGTNYGGGRQYGGPVSSGSMYRVNETGAPEMFTANNGNQYMLPSKSGSVTSADKVGGGGISVVVNVDASGSSVEGDGAQAKQIGMMLGNAIMAKLIEQKRPGGILA